MKILNRIYNDYFMPNRYNEYKNLLQLYLDNDYEFIVVSDCKKLSTNGKHIIIRHDIDTDVKIAKKMFEIEKSLGIKSTFYFRLSTFDLKLIKEILDYGSEVGYHYEEIATFVKEKRINNRQDIINSMELIQKKFINNIEKFEYKIGKKLNTIVAHGDFINRKFNINNRELFDEKIRKQFPNIIEAYDDIVEKNINARYSDCCYPKFWRPNSPLESIKNNDRNVLLLVHTRWWDKAPLSRFKEDVRRLLHK